MSVNAEQILTCSCLANNFHRVLFKWMGVQRVEKGGGRVEKAERGESGGRKEIRGKGEKRGERMEKGEKGEGEGRKWGGRKTPCTHPPLAKNRFKLSCIKFSTNL